MTLRALQGSAKFPPTHKAPLLFPTLFHNPLFLSSSISLRLRSLLGPLQHIWPSPSLAHRARPQSNLLSSSGLGHTSASWGQDHFSCLPQIAHHSFQSLEIFASPKLTASFLGSVSLDSCPVAFCLHTQGSSAN